MTTCSRGNSRTRCRWTHPSGCDGTTSITDNMIPFLLGCVAAGVLAAFIICLFWYALAG